MDKVIQILADILVAPVVLVAAYALLSLKGKERYRAIAWGVIVALTALLLAKIAAQFYQGERPFMSLGVTPKASYLPNPGFPSDHSLLVFTATIVTWASTHRRWLSLALLIMSVLVALGRVLALVHTPADVIGGMLCAVGAGLIWYGPRLVHPGVTATKKR